MAYNRVNWQDGTKISNGYVDINGERHEVIDAEYSGTTPLSSHNLNIMDAAIDKLQPNAMTIQKNTSDTNMLTNSYYCNVSMEVLKSKVGDKLIHTTTNSQLSGNPNNISCIKIGTGVSKVKVSSNVQVSNNNATSNMFFTYFIHKFNPNVHTDGIGEVIARSMSPSIAKDTFVSISIPSVLCDVEEGDYIYVRVYKGISSGVATINGGVRTYLTVEALE